MAGRFRSVLSLLVIAIMMALAPAVSAYYSGVVTSGNPLAGHPWFVDWQWGSWGLALKHHPNQAAPLRPYADNPMAKWFGNFISTNQIRSGIRSYLARAQAEEPGSIAFVDMSRTEWPSCPYPKHLKSKFSVSSIEKWVDQFSKGVGDYPVQIDLETDDLAVIKCLPPAAQVRRYREISYEVHTLHKNNPHAVVYIDAGASDWGQKPQWIAERLRKADIAEAQGFELGASHYDWTSREIRYGLAISRLLGGKHFVVNTAENGWGPKPRFYSPFYHRGCTPPGEGLGIRPTVNTGNHLIDAFVWSETPGWETGTCIGLPKSAPYNFHLWWAVDIARNANPPAN